MWPFPSAFIFPAAWRVFVRKHQTVCCSLLQWCDFGTVVWCRTCTVCFLRSLLRLSPYISDPTWLSDLAKGAGIAQWFEHRTHDWKVAGSNPCRSGGRILFSWVNFLCLLLFQYPFHHCVTAVAHKRSQLFCQKFRWEVTAKHAYTLRMWLCMKWHGAWLYGVHRTCAETAAVSCGTSHARKYTTSVDIQKRAIKS